MGPLRPLSVPVMYVLRFLSSGAVYRAGSKWRLGVGLSKSGSDYGPLTDLPDWSFADGTPAPPLKGQVRRRMESEKMARRIVMLTTELEQGKERWAEQQAHLQRQEEERQLNLPIPKGYKGGCLRSKS
ncbi:39S ribosomal protein L52, mitochondrial [Scyliorhinus canicula]|uniref:39S ribosomal protein L52, mitochondrial n=1 Tax=Scyliorhinus canicula TaxID=7830 RepID=UPI0018F6EB75|nr:39S ribosomal protein L52, mitochondrial [Scyliorhinus canicula]